MSMMGRVRHARHICSTELGNYLVPKACSSASNAPAAYAYCPCVDGCLTLGHHLFDRRSVVATSVTKCANLHIADRFRLEPVLRSITRWGIQGICDPARMSDVSCFQLSNSKEFAVSIIRCTRHNSELDVPHKRRNFSASVVARTLKNLS